MTERARKYLLDILRAADLISQYTQSIPNLAAYEAAGNELVRDAVERRLAIIGEAVNEYRREPGSPELADARKIVELRNRLVHAYDSAEQSIIWSIVKRHLPTLRAEVNALLAA